MATEIFRCVAGSRLFGTATPSSDTDYKAVELPTAEQVLLGKADFSRQKSTGNNHSHNGADDVETTTFSLQRYMRLLTEMETNSIEMLFATNQVVGANPTPDPMLMLRGNRFKVLSANKDGFTGFGKAQARRYAVRGERKTSMETLCRMLKVWGAGDRLGDTNVPYTLRMGIVPGVEIVEKPQPGGDMLEFISAFGKEMPVTCKVGEALKVFEKPLLELGKRTTMAAANGGADWKGLYHAQRVVDEGIELFSTGELRFPCHNADYYKMIRSGTLPLDQVLNTFEDALRELEEVTPIPEFQSEPDLEWATEFVKAFHEQLVIGSYEKWKAAAHGLS